MTHKTLHSMHISLSTLDSMCFLYMKDKLYSLKLPSLLFLPIFDKLFLNSPVGYLYTLNCSFKSPVLVNFQHRLLTSWQLDKGVTISALFSTPLIHLPTFVSFTLKKKKKKLGWDIIYNLRLTHLKCATQIFCVYLQLCNITIISV